MVELFEAGACVVLVPVPDGWPAAVWPLDDGDCVWAEFVDGLAFCADPEDELDGVEDEEGAVVVWLESC